MIGKLSAALGIAVVVLGAGGWIARQEVHVSDFEAVKADYLCTRCLDECERICDRNEIPPQRCDCSHCDRYCG